MTRALKVFRLHSGFYELIVAAPSKKAALAAWGANPREFAHGFATIAEDPAAVAAAIASPGMVLKRQFGSKGKFQADKVTLTAPRAPKADAARLKRERARAEAEARKAERAAAKRAEAERLQRLRELDRKQKELDAERRAFEKSVGR